MKDKELKIRKHKKTKRPYIRTVNRRLDINMVILNLDRNLEKMLNFFLLVLN